MIKLYTYFRSSAAYRVRIALNLKEIKYEPVFVNLLAGEQKQKHFLDINAQGLVPAIEIDRANNLSIHCYYRTFRGSKRRCFPVS